MAFTNYKTWSVGETLTAANFNQQIRDNGNSMGPHLIARKTSDETVNNSTTLQNDDNLLLAVTANEIWQFKLCILYNSSTAADFKMAFTFPSGSIVATAITKGNTVSTGILVGFDGASPAAGTGQIDGL